MKNSEFNIQDSKLPILVGPTGVGKSEVACHLALRMGAEILSADAFQVFKGMAVGTAQPSAQWQQKIPHHLVGVKAPGSPWSAGLFAEVAGTILKEKRMAGKKMLVVGGAGFYIRALVEGAPEGNAATPEIREKVDQKVREIGEEGAYAWLKERDGLAADRIHPHDLYRIKRALEKSLSPPEASATNVSLGREKVFLIGLERSRENLDRLLLDRAKAMWAGGLLRETLELSRAGLAGEDPALKAIGYSEALAFSRGELRAEDAVEKIFRRTRQYAKRQWTWFRHQHEVLWVDLDPYKNAEEAAEALEQILAKN